MGPARRASDELDEWTRVGVPATARTNGRIGGSGHGPLSIRTRPPRDTATHSKNGRGWHGGQGCEQTFEARGRRARWDRSSFRLLGELVSGCRAAKDHRKCGGAALPCRNQRFLHGWDGRAH